MKLKKGDEVLVTTGKDKGRKAKIEKIYPDQERVFLPGVNVYKKHLKPRGEKQPGGIVEISKPLPVANVALICPKCGQPTRVGYHVSAVSKDAKIIKERMCRKCQAII